MLATFCSYGLSKNVVSLQKVMRGERSSAVMFQKAARYSVLSYGTVHSSCGRAWRQVESSWSKVYFGFTLENVDQPSRYTMLACMCSRSTLASNEPTDLVPLNAVSQIWRKVRSAVASSVELAVHAARRCINSDQV